MTDHARRMILGLACAMTQGLAWFRPTPLGAIGARKITSPKVTVNANTNPNQASDTTQKAHIEIVFLDRDGVINQDVGAPGVIDSKQLALTPQAGKAIGNLKRAGYKVVLITNQSCIGKGLITFEQWQDDVMVRLAQMLVAQDNDASWDDEFVCTTTTDIVDERRKPAPGMILEACQKYQVDPGATIFVGDTLTDLHAATRAGVAHKILVSTGYGAGVMQQFYPQDADMPRAMEYNPTESDDNINPLQSVMPFVYVENLAYASQWILENTKPNPC